MKTFYNVVNALICCAKEARALITGNPGSRLVSRTYGARFRSGNLLENGNKNQAGFFVFDKFSLLVNLGDESGGV